MCQTMKKKFFKKNNQEKGYTIIETMIAVSLFIVITISGMGALMNANLLHQKSQSMRSIMDNLSFIMEDMGRNLRTGYNYKCYDAPGALVNVSTPKSCASGWAIAFEFATGLPGDDTDQWIYYIDNGKIFKSIDGGANFVQLTPDEVSIDQSYGFSVLGAEGSSVDSQQPFVTIRLVGKITFKNVVTPFSLQTSVSQRLVDI